MYLPFRWTVVTNVHSVRFNYNSYWISDSPGKYNRKKLFKLVRIYQWMVSWADTPYRYYMYLQPVMKTVKICQQFLISICEFWQFYGIGVFCMTIYINLSILFKTVIIYVLLLLTCLTFNNIARDVQYILNDLVVVTQYLKFAWFSKSKFLYHKLGQIQAMWSNGCREGGGGGMQPFLWSPKIFLEGLQKFGRSRKEIADNCRTICEKKLNRNLYFKSCKI